MHKLMVGLLIFLLLPGVLMAQKPPVPPSPPPPPALEIGKWWKNSEIVKKLQISETQVKQIEQIFLDHRLKLVELRAELERREIALKPLLAADQPDDARVMAQTDRVAAARGDLEKANTLMMLAIRRALSTEQWKKLEEIRASRRLPVPPTPPAPPAAPAPPAIPRPPSETDDEVYTIGDSIRAPVLTQQTTPPYTPEAKQAGIEGIIVVQAVVRKDGTIGRAKILRGLGYGLDEAAINSVKEWRFKPGTINEQPVNVRANIEVSFRLK
jgi:protein CpxP